MTTLSVQRFPEPFRYCEYYVEDFIKEANFDEVTMTGMRKTLQKLQLVLKEIFTEANYMAYDIEYHGWHGEAAKNMHKVENEIVKRLLEIYVICQMAIGGDIYEVLEDENGL